MSVRRRNTARNRGVIRDDNGIVLARTREHPGAFVFRSVPGWNPETGAVVGPFEMPPEMRQILAIHVFDNLGVPLPTDSDMRLKLVQHADGAWEWVPAADADAITASATAADDDITETVPINIDDLSPAQLNHLDDLIAQRRIDDQIRAAADQPVEPDTPEWMAYRQRRLAELQRQTQTPPDLDTATTVATEAASAPADADPTEQARTVKE